MEINAIGIRAERNVQRDGAKLAADGDVGSVITGVIVTPSTGEGGRYIFLLFSHFPHNYSHL